MYVGIGITTHNRRDIAERTIEYIKKHSKGCKIVVVDDASDTPYPNADYNFKNNVGIAKAKNKCIELLIEAGCTELFLFDDDCYPICDDWYNGYIRSPEPHLSYTWWILGNGKRNNNIFLHEYNGHNVYYSPCGCMIYINKAVIDKVGGFNEQFEKYGHEHVEYSQRVNNVGLTTYAFMDIIGSEKVFYSHDYHSEIKSSVAKKSKYIMKNQIILARGKKSKEYHKFKRNNEILTCYLTGTSDPQRKEKWIPDISQMDKLIDSVVEIGQKIIVFHDCFNVVEYRGAKLVKVKCSGNPYHERWRIYLDYIKANADLDFVFCVDATDVIMQLNPFDEMSLNILYTGDEDSSLNNEWLIKYHKGYINFIPLYSRKILLNAGLVGGHSNIIKKFIIEMLDEFSQRPVVMTDMAALNYVVYTKFINNFRHGAFINTKFKGYERNETAWFAHK